MEANEIRNAKFEITFRGYKPEDVDAFLEKAAREIELAHAERDDMEQKLKVLAVKIEDYRDEEETLKLAMLNAQRMGESILKEAKQKAEEIIREANIRTEDREHRAVDEVARTAGEMAQMRKEISRFKANVLNLYKKHIESLSALQSYEEAPDREQDRRSAFVEPAREEPVLRYEAPVEEEPAPAPAPAPIKYDTNSGFEPVREPAHAKSSAAYEPMHEAAQAEAPAFETFRDVDTSEPEGDTIEAFPRMSSLTDVSREFPVPDMNAAGQQEEDELPSVYSGFKGIGFYD